MCWSASADLAAGSVIAATGVVSVATVRRGRYLPLAGLPLVLGAHQLIESLVWRGQYGTIDPSTAAAARTVWAVIALPLLPAFVPIAVLLAAGRPVRAGTVWFAVIGLATSAALAFDVATSDITVLQHGHTLSYGIGIPAAALVIAGYLIGTLGPLVAARDRDLRLIGVIATVGAVVCAIIWREEFASTWCALAAVVSVLIVRWAYRQRAPEREGSSLGSV
jgi:hypothetical protein